MSQLFKIQRNANMAAYIASNRPNIYIYLHIIIFAMNSFPLAL